MKYIKLANKKYPRVRITWLDITGDCTTVSAEDFEELTCAKIVTEGYLYGTFERDGMVFIRTFASYEPGSKPTFGDRNVFPFSVLESKSKNRVIKALKILEEEGENIKYENEDDS
jgi:hypothetical protein